MTRSEPDDLFEGAPPHDLRLERELLCKLLLTVDDSSQTEHGERCRQVLEFLGPLDFYCPWHGYLFSELRAATCRSVPMTMGAILNFLDSRRFFSVSQEKHSVDAYREIMEMLNSTTPFHLRWHAEQLRELRLQRGRISISLDILRLAHDPGATISEFTRYASRQVKRLSAMPSTMEGLLSAHTEPHAASGGGEDGAVLHRG
jgi:hypothetical protein